MNPFVLIGAGLLLYYFYSHQTGAPAASVPSSPAPSSAASGANAQPAPAFSATYQAVVAAALKGLGPGGGQTLQSPDVWNYYLMSSVPNYTAPAPEELFPHVADAHAPVSFDAWWGTVQSFLPKGLGDFGQASYGVPQNPVSSLKGWYV